MFTPQDRHTHSDAQGHKQKELQLLAVNLVVLRSEQHFANIGSAPHPQNPQPETQPTNVRVLLQRGGCFLG